MPIYELVPEHGSLLIMAGRTQKFWRHSVPKSTREVGQRVNLTFRLVRKKREESPGLSDDGQS